MENINIKDIYRQLKEYQSESKARLILQAIVDDLIHDKMEEQND